MDAEAILTVASVVVALTQLVKWAGMPDRLGPWVVLALSAFGVVFWGWSRGSFESTQAFGYFAGWINVALAAAGTFGFTRAAPGAVTSAKSPPAGGAGANPVEKAPEMSPAALVTEKP